jgi:hypothetical protein
VRKGFLAGILACVSVAGVFYWLRTPDSSEVPVQRSVRAIEPAPICAWRNPESDLQRFFPGATGYETETRILSGRRLDLQRLLGRWPEADENSLRVYHVLREGGRAGSILSRRVKGEHGVIELLLALDTNGVVSGVAFQRIREPDEVTQALSAPAWLQAFNGKTVDADWRLGYAVPDLPPQAALSGRRIVDGVRSLLIMNQLAGQEPTARPHH